MKQYDTQELLQEGLKRLGIECEQDFFDESMYDLEVKDKIANLVINLAFTDWSIEESELGMELDTMLETII